MTIRSSVPTSPRRPALFMASWAMSLPRTPSFLLTIRASSEASVNVPRPPTKMPIRMISWPKKDQWTAVDTTVRPVTQTAETAVKSAWWIGVKSPVAEAAGSASSPVNRTITTTNALRASRAGEVLAMSSMKSRSRVKIQRPSRSGAAGCQLAGLLDLDWLCVMGGFSSVDSASSSSKPLKSAPWPG